MDTSTRVHIIDVDNAMKLGQGVKSKLWNQSERNAEEGERYSTLLFLSVSVPDFVLATPASHKKVIARHSFFAMT